MPPAHRECRSFRLQNLPAGEEDLPIQFNEWATTWGTPTHAGMVELAERLKGRGVKYLIIDAGWYKKPGVSWDNSAGDWEVSAELFPGGLKQTADAIRAAGLIPGIWFEYEAVCRDADAFQDTEHLLARMGRPLTSGVRRFWDFRQEWVQRTPGAQDDRPAARVRFWLSQDRLQRDHRHRL